MSKTGKKLSPSTGPSMAELEEMALRVCQEADRKESDFRELAKDHGAVNVDELAAKLLYEHARDRADYALEVLNGKQRASSEEHRQIVNYRHDQPGGSREKRRRMRDLWATGGFSSKEECAAKNHEALGMSFDTAIKALRNAPKRGPISKTAAEWLRDLISSGPRSSKDIYHKAGAAGYSRDAMKRAKKSIGATSVKQETEWFWCIEGARRAATP